MDGRGGCCIARYSNGGGAYGSSYDASKVNRIMLRFRPIAPKPVDGEISSGAGANVEKSDAHRGKVGVRGKRRQPQQISGNNGVPKRCNRRKASKSPDQDCDRDRDLDRTAVTLLPLLPESPEPKARDDHNSSGKMTVKPSLPTWQGFDKSPLDLTVGSVLKPVGSIVTVECVTDTWSEGYNGLGRSDEERRVNLERDTCPGFVSDGYGRVTWTNSAYREMVGGGGELMVWLVTKERVVAEEVMRKCAAFTCRVRLRCHVDGRDAPSGKTMPCDVWRMDGGGFAWRLDVSAALCLGR